MQFPQDPSPTRASGLPKRWPTQRHGLLRILRKLAGLAACGGVVVTMLPGVAAQSAPGEPPTPERQRELVRMVRQDCGSCHGMHLTGGLGPALTKEALAGKPLESLQATILRGRHGTPMSGWQSLLSEADARWIAEQLLAGFPKE